MTLLLSLLSLPAQAFCGFYVGGAGQELYSDATMVVMMRDGTKTVLSIQNSYQGPAEDFAMVVPVPVVLKKEDVKTLPRELFGKVDQLAAPRLVEYWEQDPCHLPPKPRMKARRFAMEEERSMAMADDLGVKIEAQFEVAEYDVVILSAKESTGLDTWLRKNDYNIPKGAPEVLEGYVQQGTKFFVAKVDPERVTFEDGRAVLSPLRMAYDSKTFSLPIRLGLLSAKGDQDLLVHILASDRYEVANHENVFIPTNLVVDEKVKGEFGAFYETVFANARADHDNAVVTEYAWDASTCDPCPGPTLDYHDMQTLGGDLTQLSRATLTRLHHRYNAKDGTEDLVFRKAKPVLGGRGTPNPKGELDPKVTEGSYNNFQGRYAILHPFTGTSECDNPRPGIWGGPTPGSQAQATAAPGRLQLGRTAAMGAMPVAPPLQPKKPAGKKGPAAMEADEPDEKNCATTPGSAWLALLALPLIARRRR